MPYKNKTDRLEYDRFYRLHHRIRLFDAIGLELIDPANPKSKVICTSACRKETGLVCAILHRHEVTCPMFDIVVEYLRDVSSNGH